MPPVINDGLSGALNALNHRRHARAIHFMACPWIRISADIRRELFVGELMTVGRSMLSGFLENEWNRMMLEFHGSTGSARFIIANPAEAAARWYKIWVLND